MKRSFKLLFAVVAFFAAVCAGTALAATDMYMPQTSSLIAVGDYLYGVVNYQAPGTSYAPVRVYKFDKDLNTVEYVELIDASGIVGYDASLSGNIGKVIAAYDKKLYVVTRQRGSQDAANSVNGGLLFEVDTTTSPMKATLKLYEQYESYDGSYGNWPLGPLAVSGTGEIFAADERYVGNAASIYKTRVSELGDQTVSTYDLSVSADLDGTENIGAIWNDGAKILLTSGGTYWGGVSLVSLDIRNADLSIAGSISSSDLGGNVSSYAPLGIDLDAGGKIVAIAVADKYDGVWKHTVSTIKYSSSTYSISAHASDFGKGSAGDTMVFALGSDRALVVDRETDEQSVWYGYLFAADALKNTPLRQPAQQKLPVPGGAIGDVVLVDDYIYVSANGESNEPGQFYKIALSDLTKAVANTDLKEWRPEDGTSVKPELPAETADDRYAEELDETTRDRIADTFTNSTSADVVSLIPAAFKDDLVVNSGGFVAIGPAGQSTLQAMILALSKDLPQADPLTFAVPDTSSMTALPIVRKEIGGNGQPNKTTVLFSFLVGGPKLKESTYVGDNRVAILKLFANDSGKEAKLLTQVTKLSELKDGTFMITYPVVGDRQNIDHRPMPVGGTISDDVTYTINIAVKDNGTYDLDKEELSVVDPLVLTKVTTRKLNPDDPVCTDGPGSCDTGFGLIAAAAALLFVRKKR